MQDNEFFVRCNLSSNIFNPEIKVDGKWEVAAYDLALGNDLPTTTTTTTPNVTDQIELRKKDFPILGHPPKDVERYNSFSMLMKSHITEPDRLLRPGDEAGTTALREACKRLGYGNRGTSHLSSQFDIWNYQIPLINYSKSAGWMYVDGEWLHTYWTKDPNRVVTVEELFNEMTAQILVRMPSVHDYVKDLFMGTSGEKIVTELPYLYAPEIKYVNGFMQIKVPWYITAVYIPEDIANALKLKTDSDWGRFKRIFERKLVEVPCTLTASITIRRPKIVTYDFEKERYFTRIPTKEIHEYILDNTRSSTTTRINTSNNIITITLPNTVEDTRVGIKGLPLLRITSWNKDQQYKQFLNPIYVPVRYITISNLKVDILTDSAPLKSNKGFITLHFRRRYEW